MTERECNTNYRIFPKVLATEIALHFQMELQLGKTTQWGIGKWRDGVEEGCKHWQMCVMVGEKRLIPAMCFKTRKEAEEYCHEIGSQFPIACQAIFGMGTASFSSN